MKLRNYILLPFLLLSGFSVLAQPVVNLGSDTVLCGSSLVLDAGNPGATYLWSTGEVSQSISADSSGIFWVQVTDISGTTTDSITINLIPFPTAPIVGDTSVCGTPEIQLQSTGSTFDYTIWRLNSTGQPEVGVGQQINYQVTGTSDLLVENRATGGLDSTGYVDPASGPSGNYFTLPSGRGMRFNVLRNSILESVTVYAGQAGSGTITVTDNTGAPLQSKDVSFPVVGANEIYLGYALVPGTNYRLILENPVGTYYLITSTPYNFPINQIEVTRGQPLNSQYPIFFNWKVSDIGCSSVFDTTTITSVFQPDVSLGSDTVLCDGTLQFDLSGIGALQYLWSDSSQLATFTVDTTSLIWAEGINGQCRDRDSIRVEIIEIPPTLPSFDTTLCGSQEFTVSILSDPEVDLVLWYDSPTGGTILSQDTTYQDFFSSSSTFFLEQVTLPELDSVAYSSPNEAPAGGYFLFTSEAGLEFDVFEDVVLVSVDVYATPENVGSGILPSGTIKVIDPGGTTIFDRNLEFPINGNNTVVLNLPLLPGTGYEMLLSDAQGKFYLTFTSDRPFTGKSLEVGNGIPLGSQFRYFFNWQTASSTCSPGRIPYQVNITLPNQLEDSIYSCDPLLLNGPQGASQYIWNTGSTSSQILADSTQIYSVTADDAAGCQVTYSTDFSLPVQIDLGEDGNLCGNELVSGYDLNSDILWSTNDTTPVINISSSGLFWVSVTEPRGCVLTDTINISQFSPNPVVDIGQDTSVCESLLLNAQLSTVSYLWSTGDTTSNITVTSSGLYSILVTDSLGCEGSDTIGVSVTPLPTASFSADTTGLTVSFANSSSFGGYLWDFGDNSSSTGINPVHTYSQAGIYTVRLIVSNECGSDTTELTLQVTNPGMSLNLLSPFFEAQIRYLDNREPVLYIQSSEHHHEVAFRVTDFQGRTILQSLKSVSAGACTHPITTAEMAGGLYFLHLSIKGVSATSSFVVPN